MLNSFKTKSQRFQHIYFFAAAGYAFIAANYLFRPSLYQMGEAIAAASGVMPNLAGSFATPFILLILLSERMKNETLLRSGKTFLLLNLFTFAVAVLIEYMHLWFNLGGFHLPDVLASAAGAVLSVGVFFASLPLSGSRG